MFSKLNSNIYVQRLYYCNYVHDKKAYAKSIFLPKTQFPLKLENNKLIERDKNITKVANFEELYLWQKGNLSEPEFVLHDGPPYANGNLHMGHAINKILKDTILRYHMIKGSKIHYVPGWDCHGLPIELKAITNSETLDAITIRKKAQKFAENTIENQKEVFKSWGVVGDWNNSYTTYSTEYVKNQLRIFYKIYEKGLIYRDIKPIYWSPSSRTALAEAELEYDDHHKSPSVYVKMEVQNLPALDCLKNKIVCAVIWTTTPWTLPCNQGISYNEELKYSLVKKVDNTSHDVYIVASDLVDNLSSILNCNFEILEVISGKTLANVTYVHPIYKEKICKFYNASHVTTQKGTGLVHTAPSHGPEDFLVAINNNIKLIDLIDENGCYREEAGEDFKGKFVLDEGNKTVLELIKNSIIHQGEITHSYPYDWRSKKPVIIRASQQWFVDTHSIKDKAVEALENVQIIPKINSEIYRKHLINQIIKRPYWCISRQRKWGVPIPVFYNKKDIILNENTIAQYCNLLDKYGTDFWWTLDKNEILPKNVFGDLNIEELEQGEDILDIWFDSGVSWSKVLEDRKVADMYLEGVDQINGWFQSSLLTSVALRNKSPYKTLYVHGFAVDKNGNKMSKSLGNVIDPEDIMKGNKKNKPYGVDVLRWWVACHANQDSMAHVSTNVLKSCQEEIQKIRSVLRFALGSLSDYNFEDLNHTEDLLIIDKYILHLLHQFHARMKEATESYQFHKVCSSVLNILTNSISALYYTTIKDRLYCDSIESPSRKAAQFVLYQIYEIISQTIAPIVPHLVEEMSLNLSNHQDTTYFRSSHITPSDDWKNNDIEKLMEMILKIKKDINKQTSNSLNMEIDLKMSKDFYSLLKDQSGSKNLEYELIDILQVASIVTSMDNVVPEYSILIKDTDNKLCPRCRRMYSTHTETLCERCHNVINNLQYKEKITA